ncbi:Uu.00g018870.m01.CDS01 [Anthostomella pinea]|uniref:Uu.00g018870.m01.CDS01 n=1 Tax=Anthostomella pinea TaxID=933095 RepID=A0AAI8W0E0_9PEZI|nr:Uu.00g018870.m01.CDS01 [Anthostomella pinea]
MSGRRNKRTQVLLDRGSPSPSVMSGMAGTMASTSPVYRRVYPAPTEVVSLNSSHSGKRKLSSHSGAQNAPESPHRNFAHPALAEIGKIMKSLNDALGTLQQLGLNHVASLPELVLVGDQSSGKSSLMSGLARLDLPRSSGICTRCPFHIRMSNSPHWSFTVTLQQDYEYKQLNRPIKPTDVTKKNPFPPWVERPIRETKEFKTVPGQDAVEIEEVLRWAQIATLNPTMSHEQFVPGEGSYAKEHSLEDAKQKTQAKFSPNTVAFEWKGPDIPTLSFYDLPGVFANAETKADDYLVDVVRNLTLSYVCREEAIIMLALPMDNDMDNSKTLKVIRDANAEDRTIGVVTKADKLNVDSEDVWLSVFQGQKQKVGHGFFSTSLPPDERLDTLMLMEQSFFEGGNWPGKFSEFAPRCGVESLLKYITQQLGDAFQKRLPEIKEKVKDRLRGINQHLENLPLLPSNVEHEVRMSLKEFYRQVRDSVTSGMFEVQWKRLNVQFQDCIVKMKPRVIIATDTKPKSQPIEILDSDSENSGPVKGNNKRPIESVERVIVAQKKRRVDLGSIPVTPVKPKTERNDLYQSPDVAESPLPHQQGSNPFIQCLGKLSKMDIRDIRQEIMAKTRVGLSHIVPVEVHETLSLRAVETWKDPLEIYIQKSMAMLVNAVNQALEKSLGTLQRRFIFKESVEHLHKFLKEREEYQRKRIVEMFDNEKYKMDTMNKVSIEYYKVQEQGMLERHRAFSRAKAASLLDDGKALLSWETMSAEAKAKETEMLDKFMTKLPADDYKAEIEVAALVRAYYLTAATRFIDTVTMDLNSNLFRSFREGTLDNHLDQELGLFPYPSPDTYDRLMEEDYETAEKRKQLKTERTKLQKALEIMNGLENSSHQTTASGEKLQRQASVVHSYGKVEEDEALVQDEV